MSGSAVIEFKPLFFFTYVAARTQMWQSRERHGNDSYKSLAFQGRVKNNKDSNTPNLDHSHHNPDNLYNVIERSRHWRISSYWLSFSSKIFRYVIHSLPKLTLFTVIIFSHFVDAGSTVTFLLRSLATFDEDQSIQKHVKSGKARLIKGDGLVLADVRNVWAAASLDRPVDVLIFTVGFSKHLRSFSG